MRKACLFPQSLLVHRTADIETQQGNFSLHLYFFTAFVAVDGFDQVSCSTMRTFFRLRPALNLGTTFETELCMRREVLPALGTLLKNKELVSTGRAEFCIRCYRLLAVRTESLCTGCLRAGVFHEVSKHGWHHKAKTHTNACPCLSLLLGDLL